MATQPFTDDGVRSKIQELYSLPDAMLHAETQSLRVDFRSWMHFHFDLNEEQEIFLESMEYPLIQELAEDIADCIAFRLSLYVRFFPKDIHGSKFVQPRSNLVRTPDPLKGYVVTGDLWIDIKYI